jgi:hypothetical protein
VPADLTPRPILHYFTARNDDGTWSAIYTQKISEMALMNGAKPVITADAFMDLLFKCVTNRITIECWNAASGLPIDEWSIRE